MGKPSGERAPANMPVEEVKGWTLQIFHHHNYSQRLTVTLEVKGNTEWGTMAVTFFQWEWAAEDLTPKGDSPGDPLFHIDMDYLVLTERAAADIIYSMVHKIERAVFEKDTNTGPGTLL